MRWFISILLVGCCVQPVHAQLTDAQQRSFAKRARELFQLTETIALIEGKTVPERQLAIVSLLLKNTCEVEIHQLRGAGENKTYLAPDGKSEAVYDAKGKLVQDGINDGSYNYFHPSEDAQRHFTFDMLPWLMAGQSQHDPTTVRERTSAYAADAYAGLLRGLSEARTLKSLPVPKLKEPGEIEAIAFMLQAIERGKAGQIFSLFDSERKPVKDEEAIAAIQKLELGFRAVFKSLDGKDLSRTFEPLR